MASHASIHVTPEGHGLGWKPSLPDHRDLYFAADKVQVPAKVDLEPGCGPVLDQGNLGSCTANAIGGVYQFEQKKQGFKDFVPSRLMIYYDERAVEGTVNQDSGAQIRDGMKVINSPGVCPETYWPYEVAKFTQKPPDNCYTQGTKYHSITYARVRQSLGTMKACLAAGYTFVIGISVYSSFESRQVEQTGMVPMPQTNEQLLGGHALYVIGYDDSDQRFKVRNSWGENFGAGGNVFIPYAYLTDHNLGSDYWKLTLVSD